MHFANMCDQIEVQYSVLVPWGQRYTSNLTNAEVVSFVCLFFEHM